MAIKNKKIERRLKIRRRIRKKVHGTLAMPRLSIYKSNKSIYAQLINDEKGHTLVAASSRFLHAGNNIISAKKVGITLAEKALQQGISTIVFDRSGYIYHGKVKALAEGVREKGIKF